MPFDSFLKIDGIEGESVDDKHSNEIDVLSFQWNISRPKKGKAQLADFTIIKKVDKATPQLFDAVCAGERISEANFTARKAGSDRFEFLKIKFTEVLVSSVSPAGNTSNDHPMEQVALSFGKSEITYVPQKKDGSADAPVISTCAVKATSSNVE